MTGLMFILVLAVGLVLTAIIPPIGLIILGLLALWVVFKIVKGGTKGLAAIFSSGRKAT
jgi:hypothetical protein